MTQLLLGLSAKYPEFVTASFTHDLEKITLAEDKTSQDVLDLFKGDAANG
jgi:phosphoadenosine phosphosulfate reductase